MRREQENINAVPADEGATGGGRLSALRVLLYGKRSSLLEVTLDVRL